MRYEPDPLNQFNRLIEVSPGKSYALGSRWNNVRTVNGRAHNFDAENCMAGIVAVGVDADSGGAIKSTPPAIRNHQNDFVGGIGLDDGQVAWTNLYHRTFLRPVSADWADAMDAAREGRFVMLAADYDYVPREYQEQVGGSFDHALGFCSVNADGTILRYDTLGRAPRRVPQFAVRAAAEAIALRENGTRSRLFVGFTAKMPLIVQVPPTVYRYGGKPRYRGRYVARHKAAVPLIPIRSYPSQSGAIVRRIPAGDDFACRQTTERAGFPDASYEGNSRWHGTADGRQWVNDALVWYGGPITGTEDVV